ncbi:MAG: hypothetical protein AAGJ37_08100, partial [Pseudomonadota bacterium]
QCNQIALRYLTKHPERVQSVVDEKLKHIKPDEQNYAEQLLKLPKQIQKMICGFYETARNSTEQSNAPNTAGINSRLSSTKTYLKPLATGTNVEVNDIPVRSTSFFTSNFTDKVSLEHIPTLPRLFHSMVDKTDYNKHFFGATNHWVFLLDHADLGRLTNKMLTAEFWFPRLSGELYALGVGRFEEKLYMYGAQDDRLAEREQWCHQVIE